MSFCGNLPEIPLYYIACISMHLYMCIAIFLMDIIIIFSACVHVYVCVCVCCSTFELKALFRLPKETESHPRSWRRPVLLMP